MFFLRRFTLISLVLPLFFSLGASALPSNYQSAPCVKKQPDKPTYWTLKALANTEALIGQRMGWLMTIDDADGALKFDKVKLRVVHLPANATSDADRKYEYPVLEFNSGPGAQLYTLEPPIMPGYVGYYAFVDKIEFLDAAGAIVSTAHVDSGTTLNSGGVKGIDYRGSQGMNQINMATGWHHSVADNSYMFDGSYTRRFQIGNSMTCNEHRFSNIAQGSGLAEFWAGSNYIRGTAPSIYMTSSSGNVNPNWQCNYTLEVRGMRVANGQTLVFDRKGFQPIKPKGLLWEPNKWPTFHDAYFNLRTDATGATGHLTINTGTRSSKCQGHG